MKTFIQVLIISLLIFQLGFSQTRKNTVLSIIYVQPSTTSTFQISCGMFDNSFSSFKEYGQFSDFELIQNGASLKKFIMIKSNGIDVRGKIEYVLNNRKYKYCFDTFGVFTDEKSFYKNPRLFEFLKMKFDDLNY